MKSTHHFLRLSALCTLLTCLVLPVLADQTSKPESKNKATAESKTDPWERKLSEVNFENMSLSDVVNYLGDHFREVNFVVHNSVRDIPISLQLRSVTLDDIFTAIEICTKSSVPGPGPIDPGTGIAVPTWAPALTINRVNDRMVSFTPGEGPVAAAAKPICRAFNLSRYIGSKNEKEADTALRDIEEALSTCWAMLANADGSNSKSASRPMLNLHRATKLLIVVGQPAQVEVVEQIVSQLGGEASPEGGRFGAPGLAPGGFGVPGLPGAGNSPFPGAAPRAR